MGKDFELSIRKNLGDIELGRNSKKKEKTVITDYWCPNCGNQFKAKLTVVGEKTDVSESMRFQRASCPTCGHNMTSPHVEPGTSTMTSLRSYEEEPSLENYRQAFRYADKHGETSKHLSDFSDKDQFKGWGKFFRKLLGGD